MKLFLNFLILTFSFTSILAQDIPILSEEVFEEGHINFIFHGLTTLSPDAIEAFKNEFGVGFISENCVVDPLSFKVAIATNKRIEHYLNSKFGFLWKSKLPAQPFGLK